jgi:hypothetical protein
LAATIHRGLIILLVFFWVMPASVSAQAPPLPINFGQTVEGELNDVQQAIQYIFDAEAGDEITLLMQTTSGNLNASLSLATFEGDVVASDDDGGGGTDALIQVTLQEAGSYVVTATRSRVGTGGAGNFSLSLNQGQLPVTEAPDQEVGPRLQSILRGTPRQGALTAESRFSLYWFEGRANESIIVTSDPGTNLQPLLVLFDARFTEIVRGAGGSPLSASLPADDLYFIAVAAPDALSPGGNYAITLSSGAAAGSSPTVASTPRDVQPGQNTISFGERVRGTISDTASAFTFQFSGSAGDNITINMARAGGDLDSYLFLLDSGGVALVEDDNSGGGNGDAAISASLPADGDYLILATRLNQDAGTTSGAFLLSLASDTQPIAAAPPPTSGSGTGA